ncbi:hypothetical protein DB347_17760 [Opitutaceae bacterium EW11]|nr:hypothetical protein DB347_17760 [Opitutaceae bacterium EW11]
MKPPRYRHTREQLLDRDSQGRTLALRLASEGKLTVLDPHLLDAELLNERTDMDATLVHIACRWGQLGHVPEENLTAEMLLRRDGYGYTPLETAAITQQFAAVPEAVFELLGKDAYGEAVEVLQRIHCEELSRGPDGVSVRLVESAMRLLAKARVRAGIARVVLH